MLREGHTVSFVVPREPSDLPSEQNWNGLHILRYPAGNPLQLQRELLRAVRKLNASNPIDLVIVHFAKTALGFHLSELGNKLPTLRIYHGPWDLEHAEEAGSRGIKNRAAHLLMRMVEGTSLRRSRHIICLSEYMANDARTRFGVPAEKISIIPGGVDTERFSPGDRTAARARFGYKKDEFVIFCVRRLARRMGIPNLVDAAAILKTTVPNLRVVIGGRGPLKEELEAQIIRLGLQGKVELVGFIPDEELADRYRAADLFVLPTQALEGFGLVILESFGCGTPVVGTPVGAIPDVLRPFDKRLTVKGTTATDIADAVLAIAEELPDRRNLADITTQNYSWDGVTHRLLAEAHNLIDKSSR